MENFPAGRGDLLIDLVALMTDISLRTVEARLAKYWIEQAKAGVIPRYRWSTLTELSAHLGTVPDVLSRAICELTRAGLVEMDRQQIRILNPEELAKRATIQHVNKWQKTRQKSGQK